MDFNKGIDLISKTEKENGMLKKCILKTLEREYVVLLLGCLLICGISEVYAQERRTIARINGPVTLDGLSDESAWKGIEPLPMVQHTPNFGIEPSERTEVLIAYDDNYVYAAGRLYYTEPQKILDTTKKRDSRNSACDWFGVIFDTFNDKENALGFFTTPSGLRWDGAAFNDGQGDLPLNFDWNTFWDVKSVKNKLGWFVEMRIPISSLRFQDTNGKVVMGLISWRYIAYKNERVIFPAIPPDWGFWSCWKPSKAQEIVFENIYSRKPVYITPYAAGGFERANEEDELGNSYTHIKNSVREIGMDIKYGISSNITLDVTMNTDFAQVEMDDEQINMTRFPLFFPEKRMFFQERASVFDFTFIDENRLFHSRRIGIYDGRPVRIYGGSRIVGRIGAWDTGFLTMQTAPVEDKKSENFGVLRIRRRVFNPYSYVGGIVTSRITAAGDYNRAYGFDGTIRLFKDDYLRMAWAQSFETGKENDLFSFKAARFYARWERRTLKGIGYSFSGSYAGPQFNPGMGFELRENYKSCRTKFWYGWFPEKNSPFLRHQVSLNGWVVVRNNGNVTESAQINPIWEFESKSGFTGYFSPVFYYENVFKKFSLSNNAKVPEGIYKYFGLHGEFYTPDQKTLNAGISLDAGEFYDGKRVSLGTTIECNTVNNLEVSCDYQLNHVKFKSRNQRFYGKIARLRALLTLTTSFSTNAFIQYNSVDNEITNNIRLRFNPREGNDLYLVYLEGINTNRNRYDITVPYIKNRTFLLKYTYTIQK